MTKLFSPPKASKKISELVIDDSLKEKLQISDDVYCCAAVERWTNLEVVVVEEYVSNNIVYDENGQNIYTRLLEVLQKLIDSSLAQFVTKLRKFMMQKANKVKILQIYKIKERQYHKTVSRIQVQDEIEITSNVLAADSARSMASSSTKLSPRKTNKRQRRYGNDSDDDQVFALLTTDSMMFSTT